MPLVRAVALAAAGHRLRQSAVPPRGGRGVGVALALTSVGGVVAGVRVREAAGDRRVRLRVVPAPSVVVVRANDGRGGGAGRVNEGVVKPPDSEVLSVRTVDLQKFSIYYLLRCLSLALAMSDST